MTAFLSRKGAGGDLIAIGGDQAAGESRLQGVAVTVGAEQNSVRLNFRPAFRHDAPAPFGSGH
eukprot:181-Eustigmatos_ZCMA.PRE.1